MKSHLSRYYIYPRHKRGTWSVDTPTLDSFDNSSSLFFFFLPPLLPLLLDPAIDSFSSLSSVYGYRSLSTRRPQQHRKLENRPLILLMNSVIIYYGICQHCSKRMVSICDEPSWCMNNHGVVVLSRVPSVTQCRAGQQRLRTLSPPSLMFPPKKWSHKQLNITSNQSQLELKRNNPQQPSPPTNTRVLIAQPLTLNSSANPLWFVVLLGGVDCFVGVGESGTYGLDQYTYTVHILIPVNNHGKQTSTPLRKRHLPTVLTPTTSSTPHTSYNTIRLQRKDTTIITRYLTFHHLSTQCGSH